MSANQIEAETGSVMREHFWPECLVLPSPEPFHGLSELLNGFV